MPPRLRGIAPAFGEPSTPPALIEAARVLVGGGVIAGDQIPKDGTTPEAWLCHALERAAVAYGAVQSHFRLEVLVTQHHTFLTVAPDPFTGVFFVDLRGLRQTLRGVRGTVRTNPERVLYGLVSALGNACALIEPFGPQQTLEHIREHLWPILEDDPEFAKEVKRDRDVSKSAVRAHFTRFEASTRWTLEELEDQLERLPRSQHPAFEALHHAIEVVHALHGLPQVPYPTMTLDDLSGSFDGVPVPAHVVEWNGEAEHVADEAINGAYEVGAVDPFVVVPIEDERVATIQHALEVLPEQFVLLERALLGLEAAGQT